MTNRTVNQDGLLKGILFIMHGIHRPLPYQGCGLGLLVHVRECMGEDPAPIGETLALREEEQR